MNCVIKINHNSVLCVVIFYNNKIFHCVIFNFVAVYIIFSRYRMLLEALLEDQLHSRETIFSEERSTSTTSGNSL